MDKKKITALDRNRSRVACFQGKSAHSLSRQVIEPVALAFKASVISIAPVVLH